MIHPSAVVSPRAVLAADVRIGPFCIVEDDVELGAGCILEARAIVKRKTRMGRENHVYENTIIGGPPQHLQPPTETGGVTIGARNVFRENGTVHCALKAGENTVIGDDNFLMVGAHVAHDCVLGNHVIVTNNSLLAGHVTVGDRAYLSGGSAVHQFCRIGTLAMVGGQGHITRDVPPYVTVDGLSSLVVGLNSVGLRRAGFLVDDVRTLKAAYRTLYRSGLPHEQLLAELQRQFPDGPAAEFHRFLATSKRGIISERRPSPGAILKLRREEETANGEARKAQPKVG